jgi:murein DD-endopeptidase MepM/ murein hydrolase activator NlpD
MIKCIYLLMLVIVPTVLGSSSYNIDYKTSNVLKTNTRDINIISSVPNGFPLDKDKIRCHLDKCSGFGMRYHPIKRISRMHKGVDLPAKLGTPIRSTSYGVVHKVKKSRDGYGNVVIIKSGNYSTVYAHCKEIFVKKGQKVSLGEVIASVGSSGLSTGPHLHYEVKKDGFNVNPKIYL